MESGIELITSLAHGIVEGVPAVLENMATFMSELVTWVQEQFPHNTSRRNKFHI